MDVLDFDELDALDALDDPDEFPASEAFSIASAICFAMFLACIS